MNAAQENQVITAGFLKRVQREVNPVVDRRQVIQPRRAIGIADGNKISVTVLLIDGHDFRRRESMDGGENWRLNQPAVSQRHEIVVVVDEIKLSSVLKRFGDVKIFGHLGIGDGILFISLVHHSMQMSTGDRIAAGE
jgi:hypothetical protein